jgi:thioredoxin-related protein
MNTPRLLLILTMVVWFFLTSYSCARDETDPTQAVSNELPSPQQSKGLRVKWLDFNDGMDKARTENKPIFVEFYTDWCVYCKMFQRETVQDQSVASVLAENFVYVRLNAEDTQKRVKFNGKYLSNTELTQSFGISAFPSLVFLDSTGQIITTFSGFMPARQFAGILDYIHQKCYQTQTSIHEFARRGNCD